MTAYDVYDSQLKCISERIVFVDFINVYPGNPYFHAT